MNSHKEQIECPECETRQMATVLHTEPFHTYVHHCVVCKYTITESDWVFLYTEDEINIKNQNED